MRGHSPECGRSASHDGCLPLFLPGFALTALGMAACVLFPSARQAVGALVFVCTPGAVFGVWFLLVCILGVICDMWWAARGRGGDGHGRPPSARR